MTGLFRAAYVLGWAGVVADLASLPAWLWAPAYLVGLATCAASPVPDLIETARLYYWAFTNL